MGSPSFEDVRRRLQDLNAEDAEHVRALAAHTLEDGVRLDACRRYADAILASNADRLPFDPVGASTVVECISSHPAFGDGREQRIGGPVLGRSSDDPAEFATRSEAAEFLIVGSAALAFEERLD